MPEIDRLGTRYPVAPFSHSSRPKSRHRFPSRLPTCIEGRKRCTRVIYTSKNCELSLYNGRDEPILLVFHSKVSLMQHPTIPLQSIADLRCKWDWSKVKAQL